MSAAVSAHGTLIKRNGTTIGEVRDITPPALNRNTFETTTQNDGDSSFITGVRRHGEMTFQINFLPSSEATHGASTGLIAAFQSGSKDLYEVDFTDGTHKWLFSGFVTNIAPSNPADGEASAAVTIMPTNAMIFS